MLNAGVAEAVAAGEEQVPEPEPAPGLALATELNAAVLALVADVVDEDGGAVAYGDAAGSEAFDAYCAAARRLRGLDPAALRAAPVPEAKAFWLNTYNALTIHGLVAAGALGSVLDVDGFWGSSAYDVGGERFSLDDIEHGLLRGNRPHCSAPPGEDAWFEAGDLRAELALELDPRVHFALVCGARSCPPIRVFSPANVDFALTAAARGFCNREVEVDEARRAVTLSKLFDWYGDDFGADDAERLERVADWLPEGDSRGAAIRRLLADGEPPSVEFAPYDWALNVSA